MTTLALPDREKGGLIGLDLARSTGWSYAAKGGLPAGGTWKLPDLHVRGEQAAAFEHALWQVIERYEPRWIYIEAAMALRKTDQIGNYRTAFGLAEVTAKIAFQAEVQFRDIAVSTARARVLRDGYPPDPKGVAMRFCQERGWEIWNHDQADAEIVREAGMLNVWGAGAACPGGAFDGCRWWRDELV